MDGNSALTPLPPTDVRFLKLSSSSVTLAWRAPELSTVVNGDDGADAAYGNNPAGGGDGGVGFPGVPAHPVETYKIYMLSFLGRDGPSSPLLLATLPAAGPQPYSFTHASLDIATWYRLAVTATSAMGEGPLSHPVDFVTCIRGEVYRYVW